MQRYMELFNNRLKKSSCKVLKHAYINIYVEKGGLHE
jgi:hypothetical protein